MTNCYESKEDVVQSVNEMLRSLGSDFPWTMTITRVPSEGYYALTVTDGSSEDTELRMAKFFSETQVNT